MIAAQAYCKHLGTLPQLTPLPPSPSSNPQSSTLRLYSIPLTHTVISGRPKKETPKKEDEGQRMRDGVVLV